MKFLSTLAARSHHCSMFEGGDTLKIVCEQVILPNLSLRGKNEVKCFRQTKFLYLVVETDVEEFEDNAEEYIRKDIEKSGKSRMMKLL